MVHKDEDLDMNGCLTLIQMIAMNVVTCGEDQHCCSVVHKDEDLDMNGCLTQIRAVAVTVDLYLWRGLGLCSVVHKDENLDMKPVTMQSSSSWARRTRVKTKHFVQAFLFVCVLLLFLLCKYSVIFV